MDFVLEETVGIYVKIRFENTEKKLSKIEFKELLSLVATEFNFIFNGKLYRQVGGVTMVSPLGNFIKFRVITLLEH